MIDHKGELPLRCGIIPSRQSYKKVSDALTFLMIPTETVGQRGFVLENWAVKNKKKHWTAHQEWVFYPMHWQSSEDF